jgi:hypothetical protein
MLAAGLNRSGTTKADQLLGFDRCNGQRRSPPTCVATDMSLSCCLAKLVPGLNATRLPEPFGAWSRHLRHERDNLTTFQAAVRDFLRRRRRPPSWAVESMRAVEGAAMERELKQAASFVVGVGVGSWSVRWHAMPGWDKVLIQQLLLPSGMAVQDVRIYGRWHNESIEACDRG